MTSLSTLADGIAGAPTLELRDYQRAALDAIHSNRRKGIRRQLVSLPTGAGKTVLAAHLIRETEDLPRTVFLVQKAQDGDRQAVDELLTRYEGRLRTIAAAIVKDLPAALVSTFDTVLKARRGVAVSKVEGGLCAACHVRVRPQVLNDLIKGESVRQCDSCQRILYTVPAKPADAVSRRASRKWEPLVPSPSPSTAATFDQSS